MKVLLFEWLTGGGLWLDNISPDSVGNMLHQGSAMVSAVGLDLAKFAEVELLVDSRLNKTLATSPGNVNLGRLDRVANVQLVDSEQALKSKLSSLASDVGGERVLRNCPAACLAECCRNHGW